jgi:replicative DNA helicase
MIIDLQAAEKAFVGTCLWSRDDSIYASDLLEPTQLTVHENRIIYSAILSVINANGDPSDRALIMNTLAENKQVDNVGGEAGVNLIAQEASSRDNLPIYADIIKREGLRKRAMASVTDFMSDILSGCPEQAINDLRSSLKGQRNVVNKMRGLTTAEMLRQGLEEAESMQGQIATGIGSIDFRLGGGLSPTSFTIIGASPSSGKSAFAINLMLNSMRGINPARCLFISMEMGSGEIADRMVAANGNFNLTAAKALRTNRAFDRFGQNSSDELEAIQKRFGSDFTHSMNQVAAMHHVIQCEGLITCAEFRSLVSLHKDECDFIVLDYIQQIKPEGNQKTLEKVNEISWTCKDIAMKYKKPVIALSQFNRGGYKDNVKPAMSDLRESGQLEQDADNIFLLWREKKPDLIKEDLEVNIAKNRSGPIGICNLTFELNKGRIY